MSVLFPPYLCVCVSSQRRYRCTYIDSLFVCWCVCVWESWWVCFTVPDIFFVCVFSYVLYICVVFGPHAGRGLAVLPLFIWHFLINEVCPPSSSSSSSSSSFSCTPLTLSVPPHLPIPAPLHLPPEHLSTRSALISSSHSSAILPPCFILFFSFHLYLLYCSLPPFFLPSPSSNLFPFLSFLLLLF